MTEWLKPEILIQVVLMTITGVCVGVASYFAVKSDLRAMHERILAHGERIAKIEGDVSNIIFSGDRRRTI